MTSVITTVRFGSRPRAIVHRRTSSLPIEVPLAEVARFVAQTSARRAELQVVSVQVEIPAEILRLGFEFVDTPGVGSAIEINTATTRQFLPEADAVIFVTGFDSPLTDAEAGFLTDAASHAGRLFLVLNKRDLVSGCDAAEAAEFVRRRVRDDLGIGEPRLFGLSALEALEAVVQGEGESGRRGSGKSGQLFRRPSPARSRGRVSRIPVASPSSWPFPDNIAIGDEARLRTRLRALMASPVAYGARGGR